MPGRGAGERESHRLRLSAVGEQRACVGRGVVVDAGCGLRRTDGERRASVGGVGRDACNCAAAAHRKALSVGLSLASRVAAATSRRRARGAGTQPCPQGCPTALAARATVRRPSALPAASSVSELSPASAHAPALVGSHRTADERRRRRRRRQRRPGRCPRSRSLSHPQGSPTRPGEKKKRRKNAPAQIPTGPLRVPVVRTFDSSTRRPRARRRYRSGSDCPNSAANGHGAAARRDVLSRLTLVRCGACGERAGGRGRMPR